MENQPKKDARSGAPRRAVESKRPVALKIRRILSANLAVGGFLLGIGVSVLWFAIHQINLALGFPFALSALNFLAFFLAVALCFFSGAVLFLADQRNQSGRMPFAEMPTVDKQAGCPDPAQEGLSTPVVAIGGGTGLSTLLRGMKMKTHNLTAVVTVADDGGSSGRLRRSLGIPPPGDLRNCLAALAEDEALLTQLFQYRFAEGDGIHGHAFGNLFVSALAGVTGNFERGLIEAGKVLSIRGRVVPSTLSNVTLEGELIGERTNTLRRVSGESRIAKEPGAIWRVWIEPENARAYPGAVQAILNAELIILGPGSLFTSVLPNLLIREIREAIEASRALKVYVCNLTTQPGETDGFSVRDHLEAIERHITPLPFQVVLANIARPMELPEGLQWVDQDATDGAVRILPLDLADEVNPGHHDPEKLATALAGLLAERTGRSNS